MHTRPFVSVFIAYAECDGQLTSPEYDDPSVRAEIDGWMQSLGCEWEWVAVSASTLDTEIHRVREHHTRRRVVVLNLCDGDDVNGYPGVSVVKALEAANVPFTGARSRFYGISTSKRTMKRRFAARGVPTAPFVRIRNAKADIRRAGRTLGWPIFVKPDVAAGSTGITTSSRAGNIEDGIRAAELAVAHGGLIAEPFLAGREFTVLVLSDGTMPDGLRALAPVERVFNEFLPIDQRFLTSDTVMDEGADNHAYSYAPAPGEWHDELTSLARRAVHAVEGSGYARVDIRYDADPGVPLVLEVNANCGLTADVTSAVGSILEYSGTSIASFVDIIVADALQRHRPGRGRRFDRTLPS